MESLRGCGRRRVKLGKMIGGLRRKMLWRGGWRGKWSEVDGGNTLALWAFMA